MGGILLVRLSALGDIVHALPVARALRRSMSGVRLYWAVERRFADFVRSTGSVDDVIEVDTSAWRAALFAPRTWSSIRRLRRRLVSLELEYALDLQGLLKSAAIARMAGAATCLRMPREHLREKPAALLIRDEVSVPPEATHVVEKNLCFASHLGADVSQVDFGRLFTDGDAEWAEAALAEMGVSGLRAVMLWPGGNWPTKRWPADRFAQLGRRLGDVGRVVVGWGPGERDLAEEVASSVPGACLAPEAGISRLAALIGKAALFVGGDTGPLHIAAAVGVPTVGIYGPTSPRRNGPYGRASRVIFHPCTDADIPCHRRRCSHWTCLPSIGVDEVASACRQLLEGRA